MFECSKGTFKKIKIQKGRLSYSEGTKYYIMYVHNFVQLFPERKKMFVTSL